jgi:hypothetical protein
MSRSLKTAGNGPFESNGRPQSTHRQLYGLYKLLHNSYVTSCRTIVHLRDQLHLELKGPRDTKVLSIVPSFGFNPAVFRPLTLVPIQRVLGVPLANEIGELMALSQRANNHRFKCASFDIGWDFRRKYVSDGTSPSQNNGTVVLGTKYGLRLNGYASFMAPLRCAIIIVPTNGCKSRR